jgi:hypothetical protein
VSEQKDLRKTRGTTDETNIKYFENLYQRTPRDNEQEILTHVPGQFSFLLPRYKEYVSKKGEFDLLEVFFLFPGTCLKNTHVLWSFILIFR